MRQTVAAFVALSMLSGFTIEVKEVSVSGICSAGYCEAKKAPAPRLHGGKNPHALCLQIIQAQPDAVVLQTFDAKGRQLRISNGKELDRWRASVIEREGGKIYPDRSTLEIAHSAIICNGAYHVQLDRAAIEGVLAEHRGDSCPPPEKHLVCLAERGVCLRWRENQ